MIDLHKGKVDFSEKDLFNSNLNPNPTGEGDGEVGEVEVDLCFPSVLLDLELLVVDFDEVFDFGG